MAKATAKKPAAKKPAARKAPAAAKNNQPESQAGTLAGVQPEHAAPVEHVDNTVKVSGHRDGSL